jgi:UDP-N-acetylmuramate dehydrogenase
MELEKNVSLKSFNTFGLDQLAEFFTEVSSAAELIETLAWADENNLPVKILGGGSNILITGDIRGIVVKVNMKGITPIEETDTYVLVKVAAGENWHDFVQFAISKGWGGIENLSLIPGTVGAAPIQNIGAYGVEIKDVFQNLEAVDRNTGRQVVFDGHSCSFGYRESFFKRDGRDRFVICAVTFRLSKTPAFQLSYGTVEETMHELGYVEPTLEAVGETICFIRKQKLPDPSKIGNAGSFFKNPVIEKTHFEKIKKKHPTLHGFPVGDGIKIPAAWLIEQSGWKGKRWGTVGVHERQPLVLVNYGSGKGRDLLHLSQCIQESVFKKFQISLEPEVNLW